MSSEFEGRVGPVSGKYKRTGIVPHVIEPCHHLVYREKALRKDRLLIVHGQADGENKITEHAVGEDK